jgi:putative addiction module component (TIGR02574 family)
MSSKVPMPPPGFDELSTDDQIEYLNELWDRISSDPRKLSIPDSDLEILRERLARYEAEGRRGRTWEEFEADLIDQLNKT